MEVDYVDIIKVGSIVARKSYNMDIFFRVDSISSNIATLKGISYRIEADASLDDLVLQNEDSITRYYNDTIMPADRKIDRICRDKEACSTKKKL
jgi:spore coat assemly protein